MYNSIVIPHSFCRRKSIEVMLRVIYNFPDSLLYCWDSVISLIFKYNAISVVTRCDWDYSSLSSHPVLISNRLINMFPPSRFITLIIVDYRITNLTDNRAKIDYVGQFIINVLAKVIYYFFVAWCFYHTVMKIITFFPIMGKICLKWKISIWSINWFPPLSVVCKRFSCKGSSLAKVSKFF